VAKPGFCGCQASSGKTPVGENERGVRVGQRVAGLGRAFAGKGFVVVSAFLAEGAEGDGVGAGLGGEVGP